MSIQLKTRNPKQKLHLTWSEETTFAVTVRVRAHTEPRFLKNFTISIQPVVPGFKPPGTQFLVKP